MKKALMLMVVVISLVAMAGICSADPRRIGMWVDDVPAAKFMAPTHDSVPVVYPSKLVEMRDLYLGR